MNSATLVFKLRWCGVLNKKNGVLLITSSSNFSRSKWIYGFLSGLSPDKKWSAF